MLSVALKAQIMNEDCLTEANGERNLIKSLIKTTFFGHVMGREDLKASYQQEK